MKAEYFVVAFCLLFTGAFLTYEKHKLGWNQDSSIVISGDNFYEEIKYSGKISFSDDETSIKSISPNGYLNFRKNEDRLIASTNKEGQISYQLFEAGNKLSLDSNGKKLIAGAVREMIALGIDAEARMERIYHKGGNQALIKELNMLKNDNVKRMYFEHILKSDSLSAEELEELAASVSTAFGSDEDKANVLRRFTKEQLKDSVTMHAYMHAIESFSDDYSKTNALKNIVNTALPDGLFKQVIDILNGVSDENEREKQFKNIIIACQPSEMQIDELIEAGNRLNDDILKEDLMMQLMGKDASPEKHVDKILDLANHLNDDMQKENIYKKLMALPNLSEQQWVDFIHQISGIHDDFEKSNLLIQLYPKMPKSDSIKATFLQTAKTINDDSQYGRVLRSVE